MDFEHNNAHIIDNNILLMAIKMAEEKYRGDNKKLCIEALK